MKTFFILGRNPKLSRAEVLEFLKARNRTHTEILFEENILVIETNEGERFNIQEFGGVIHLGEITFEGTHEELEKHLESEEIVPSDKFSYALYGDSESQILKEKFKSMKKKASEKHGKKMLKLQGGEKLENPKADFHIFFHQHEKTLLMGLASQSYDSSDAKSRDMKKPVRRESLAISPRLSKILINLSGAKPHGKLLDPFCGIGGILLEALVKKINVYGIDKDSKAIEGAKKNLSWLTENYPIQTKYQVENNDSRKAPDLQFTAIATETPLGKLLRKKPSENQAKQIIQNFESFIIPILTKLKKVKKPEAKIAITFPVIRNIHTDTSKIAAKTGLKIYINPILESRKDQFISRDIVVFQ
jgi:tRNA G10  N-methylase Trm11